MKVEEIIKSAPLELEVMNCAQFLATAECQFVDVREDQEWAHCRIEGAIHIPMRDIPARLGEIDADRPAIIYCHHGVRSAQVVRWLRQNGYALAINMSGGIDHWSLQVDPAVVRY